MSAPRRHGFTISTSRYVDDPRLAGALAEHGFSDAWTAEVGGADGVTPLAVMAGRTDALRFGTAVLPAFTRGPALLAQTAATMAAAAPGRFVLGIGASSPVVVRHWNGIAHERAFERTRDVLRFLRAALAGERVSERYDTFEVAGFKLDLAVPEPPTLLLAALRPGMLRLAGREADGAIVNWLAAADVPTVRAIVDEAAGGAAREVAGRVFVVPTGDAERARAIARRAITAYLNVPVYAKFHEWLGRGPLLQPMWEAWRAGDRRGALAAVPDEVVDDLVVHGEPEACRRKIDAYLDAGLDTAILMVLDPDADPLDAVRLLAPRRP